MSKFVNFKKRSVTLPPGCKDLIDVLQPTRPPEVSGTFAGGAIDLHQVPTVTHGESGPIKLSEIENRISTMLAAQTHYVALMLSTPDERFTIEFAKMDAEMIGASLIFGEDADRERLVREFLVRHSLQAPQTMERPEMFYPDHPVQNLYDLSPLPPDAPTLAKLVAEFFQEVCGLKDDSELTFHYYRDSTAA